jgi:four helix bundle protein
MQDHPFARPPHNIQERSFQFACRIVKLHQYLYKRGATEREISRQVIRSGTSIGANLEEADAGQSKPDFISKCGIALKEARETHYWLRLLRDTHLIPLELIAPLIDEARQLVAILTTIVKNTRNASV